MSFRNLTAAQKGLVLILVPVVFELGLLAFLAKTLLDAEATLKQIDYSRRAVLALQAFETRTFDALITAIDQRQGQVRQVAALTQLINNMTTENRLGNLTAEGNPELQKVLKQANHLNSKVVGLFSEWRNVETRRQMTPADRANTMPTIMMVIRMYELKSICDQIAAIENRSAAAEPRQLDDVRSKIFIAIGGGIALSFFLSLGLLALFTSDILNRLKRISASALSLVKSANLPRPQPGRDEIAQLERSLYEASTALAEIRRKESAVLDHAADVICSLDADLRFTGVNAAVERLWQFAPDDLLGTDLLKIIETERQSHARHFFEQLPSGTGGGVLEIRVVAHDGALKDSRWKVKWSGKEKKFFCVVHDLTEQRAVERLRQQFLSMVCHDLRNPIMSVGIGLELLTARESGSMNAAVQEEFQKIYAGSERLTALTSAFLDLEKLESGLAIADQRMVSLQDACVVALEIVGAMADLARVDIEPPAAEATVWADEDKLVTAVANMLTYAVSVSPRDSSVHMVVSKSSDFVQLQIVDAGPPVPDSERALIFERFRMGLDTKKGSGRSNPTRIAFGLAAARAIVEGHHGSVGFGPDQNHRNCMWLRLPEYVDEGGDDP